VIEQAAEAITEGRDAVRNCALQVDAGELPLAVRTLGEEHRGRCGESRSAVFQVEVEASRAASIQSFGTRFIGLRARRCATRFGTHKRTG